MDNLITLNENKKYSPLIDILRLENSESYLQPEPIAGLIAHLESRTQNLRKNFLDSSSYLIDELLKFIANTELFGVYLKRHIEKNPHDVIKELKKHGLPIKILPEFIKHLSSPSPKLLSPILTQLREKIPLMLKSGAKSGHINALTQSIEPTIKTEKYEKLIYRIVLLKDISIPLGDSIVFFQISNDRKFKPFLDKDDQLIAAFLPLGQNRLLIGSTLGHEIDLSEIPKAIVSCSHDFFITNEKSDYCDSLKLFIGNESYLLSKPDMEIIISEILFKE